MRIAIVTDAWAPQVNGVVRALTSTIAVLRARGHDVLTVTPEPFRTIPCPTYPDIRLAIGCGAGVARMLADYAPDAVHIATEGPIGWAARRWCLDYGMPFTTSFHTRFPDYAALRTGLPAKLFWPTLRRFHAPASRVMVATAALSSELAGRGFGPLHRWPLGIDRTLFNDSVKPLPALASLPRPIMLFVGRIAVEKNISAFLELDVPGTKVIVGDGPARAALQRRFPAARFLGAQGGATLASCYAAADVFVFPSRTDTLGLVNLEALACRVPVAAYPVRGPLDILGFDGTGLFNGGERIGALDSDLAVAIELALAVDRTACAREGAHYGWERCTDAFERGLAPEHRRARAAA
jgi:glycosyltransferase involved in cell wall biosynthesis